MHNCSKTKEQTIELLLDGIDQPPDSLSNELHACRECSAEFDALNATLRLTSRLKHVSTPSEFYWASYHDRLRQKLIRAAAPTREPVAPSWLISFFKSSIRVPVPVAAAAVIVFAVLFSLSFRKSEQPNIQPPSVVHVPVEVPVIQEKIVTRVVYKDRWLPSRKPTHANANPTVENTFAKSQVEPSLNGFKPAEDAKLTVIKGGSTNEQ